jgi:hypothetical protein
MVWLVQPAGTLTVKQGAAAAAGEDDAEATTVRLDRIGAAAVVDTTNSGLQPDAATPVNRPAHQTTHRVDRPIRMPWTLSTDAGQCVQETSAE